MGKSITLQDEDLRRIETLKVKIGASTKVEVLRVALEMLERDVERRLKVERWQRAATLVGQTSAEVNRAFRKS
jgi:hypothetical protein